MIIGSLICRKTMRPCTTMGMCSPFGGCREPSTNFGPVLAAQIPPVTPDEASMSANKMRDAFDEWARNQGLDTTYDGSHYWPRTNTSWLAWQAASAAQAGEIDAMRISLKWNNDQEWAHQEQAKPVAQLLADRVTQMQCNLRVSQLEQLVAHMCPPIPMGGHGADVASVQAQGAPVDEALRLAAERTRADLGPTGDNYPAIRKLLSFAESTIAALTESTQGATSAEALFREMGVDDESIDGLHRTIAGLQAQLAAHIERPVAGYIMQHPRPGSDKGFSWTADNPLFPGWNQIPVYTGPSAQPAPLPHANTLIGKNDHIPDGWTATEEGQLIPPAGLVGTAYSAAPVAMGAIIKEISDHLGISPEQVKPESTFAQLGADSLDVIELTMGIEDALEIEVEALDNLTTACTVKDFTDAILEIYAAKATA